MSVKSDNGALTVFFSLQLHAGIEKNGVPHFKLRWSQTPGQMFHEEKTNKEEGIAPSLCPKLV